MTFLSRRHALRAERLVLAMKNGDLDTQGKLAGWLSSCALLPPDLRVWVFKSIAPFCGDENVAYLQGLMPVPLVEVTV